MKHLFHSATVRLTAWYTLILLFISLLFSTVVYQISLAELHRTFGPAPKTDALFFIDNDAAAAWRNEHIKEGISHLMGRLVVFNLLVLTAGAAGSYFLARQTLRPIEEAMDAQARFSSDAAHELRTPLTIMQSEIEVGLRNSSATKSDYATLLHSTLDEVEHMRTLTDRLLLLANQNELVLAPTSIENVAIDAVNRSIPLAQSKHITVENEVGTITVQGNAQSLTDVLFILLDNAIKYSPEKSTIKLQAHRRGHLAEITVSDTGPGIAAKDLPHIFDRFYRADTSRSSQNVAGHGLGLSIAQRILQAHGGSITAANNADKGAAFTLTLPLA